jgi:hypothetical protein
VLCILACAAMRPAQHPCHPTGCMLLPVLPVLPLQPPPAAALPSAPPLLHCRPLQVAAQIARHSAPAVAKAKECIAVAQEAALGEGLRFEKREVSLVAGGARRSTCCTCCTCCRCCRCWQHLALQRCSCSWPVCHTLRRLPPLPLACTRTCCAVLELLRPGGPEGGDGGVCAEAAPRVHTQVADAAWLCQWQGLPPLVLLLGAAWRQGGSSGGGGGGSSGGVSGAGAGVRPCTLQ